MHYHIYCKAKTIPSNHKAAIAEFEKRLSAYCSTAFHNSTSLTFPKNLNGSSQYFLFVHNGVSTYSSMEFAKYINEIQLSGKSTIHVIIGYTENELYEALESVTGYHQPVSISFTKNSLSAKTLALLFYEQLYRGYTILQGKTYHK
ncbi:MAG: 23S rRNA (pseudouridine(1915)-N(3))-methyltransferase RlmH [Lachnospiraceae bacterium]|nr:23S rRNA (pseudouridine(1915)-N(3))-methyltransferase RlmH [Lachnospiraceae bacterium]